MCFLKEESTHRTQKTHVDMYKKELQGQKQNKRKPSYPGLSGQWSPGHESFSALARRPCLVKWTSLSLWPGALWQWSCIVLSASWHKICQQQQGLRPKVDAAEFLGTVGLSSPKWGIATKELLLPRLNSLASSLSGLAHQPLWILRAFIYNPVNYLWVSSIKVSSSDKWGNLTNMEWPKPPNSSLIPPSSNGTW